MNSVAQNPAIGISKHKILQLNKIASSERLFRTLYIISLVVSSICLIEPMFKFISGSIMIWGAFLLIQRALYSNTGERMRYCLFPTLFILSGIVTLLLNFNNQAWNNFVFLYHNTICIFLLYGLHRDNNASNAKEEMLFTFQVVNIINTILASAGLVIMVIFRTIIYGTYTIGLNGGRYTGLYTHPNIAAFVSTMCLVMTLVLYTEGKRTNKHLISNPLLIVSIIVNLLTIFLADSNNSLIYIVTYFMFFFGLQVIRSHKHIVRRLCLVLLSTGLVALLVFGVRSISQLTVSTFLTSIDTTVSFVEDTIMNGTTSSTTDQETPIAEELTPQKTPTVVGRPVTREDWSSGRIGSLIRGLQLYTKFPLWGVGKANIIDYGTRYLSSGFEYFDLHNGYLTILVSSGIIGFLFFFIFGLQVASRIVKTVIHKKYVPDFCLYYLVPALGSYCIYAFFERALLNSLTFMVVIFWLLLGYATTFANQSIADVK